MRGKSSDFFAALLSGANATQPDLALRLIDQIIPRDPTIAAQEVRDQAKKIGLKLIPFDIVKYAAAVGLYISYEALEDDISGYIEQRADGWVLAVCQFDTDTRKRFTIAHELGHIILHRKFLEHNDRYKEKILYRTTLIDRIESEANDFAAALLMPEDEFKVEYKKGPIESVATYFNVSTQAVRLRAYKLRLASSF